MKIEEALKYCQQCAYCCRKDAEVTVSESEIELLEEVTGVQRSSFVMNGKYHGITDHIVLKAENGRCMFLEGEGPYSCIVYEYRPSTCKNFPDSIKQENCIRRIDSLISK